MFDDVEVEKIRADERAKVIDEVLQLIHNIYVKDLYCADDTCESYDCEDCLFKQIKQKVEKLKGKNNDSEIQSKKKNSQTRYERCNSFNQPE